MDALSLRGASLVLTSNPLYWSLPGVAVSGQTPKGRHLLSCWVFSRAHGTLLYSLSVRIVTGLERHIIYFLRIKDGFPRLRRGEEVDQFERGFLTLSTALMNVTNEAPARSPGAEASQAAGAWSPRV